MDERSGLIALYHSAGGESWKNRDGWLGERGTECDWHGVRCGFGRNADGSLSWSVNDLDLSDNGLKGTLPREIDSLTNLEWLRFYGSELAGALPPRTLERWESGQLMLQGYGDLAGVSEIDLRYESSEYCVDFDATLRSDGSIMLASDRCKGEPRMKWQGGKGLKLSCEKQTGKTDRFGDAFGRLVFLFERQGFASLSHDYGRAITHGGTMTASVVRRGERTIVQDYAEAGPMSLWLIESAVQGVIHDAIWEKSRRAAGTCAWSSLSPKD